MKDISIWKWLMATIIILAVFIYVPTYITGPDGLEALFEASGFTPPPQIWGGILPDYRIPGIVNEWATTLFSGILGTVIVFAVAYGIGKLVVVKK